MKTTTKSGRVATVLAAALALGVAPFAIAADATSFKAAIEAAEASRAAAAAVGFEWRDTKKIMGKAQAAADKGDFEMAEKLAMQAQKQGEYAVAQASEQAEIWKAAVLK